MAIDIGRRQFISALGGAAVAWSKAARAQQTQRMRRIGVLLGTSENEEGKARVAAFEQGLEALGWRNGQNVQIQYKWSDGDADRINVYAAELVHSFPDLIVASNTPVVSAITSLTQSIPIIFVMVSDPVGSGFVESMAHPGRNITGFTNFEYSTATKWIELLKKIDRNLERVAMIVNPETSPGNGALYTAPIVSAANILRVEAKLVTVHGVDDIERTFTGLTKELRTGVIVLPDSFTTSNVEPIVELLSRHPLPSAFAYRIFVVRGGMVAYGVDSADIHWRAASYVDRVLQGADPGNLPVQAPTKFELVINLRTAKSLGLTVPPSLIAIADEVLE